jgi:mycobactin lysine-N-oxygenase
MCTPPDNDLGYPYRADFVENTVAEKTYQLFSWAVFKVSCPDPQEYSEWTDRGRTRVSHDEFASYLRWAFERAGNAPKIANVSKLIPQADGWRLEAHTATTSANFGPYDGVVVSGPGGARPNPLTHAEGFYNGVNFWQSTKRIEGTLHRNPTGTIVVYGGGGTAAAILGWFARSGFEGYQIQSLTSQAMLYTRGNNFFERRLFTDADAWNRLSPSSRRAFVNRLNRGVVWDTMADQISRLERLSLAEGRVTRVERQRIGPAGSRERGLEVYFDAEKGPASISANLVIDATGFDEWWFRSLLPDDWRDKLEPTNKVERDRLRDGIQQDLSFGPGWTLPRLHVPMLADLVGPGTTNLLSLGDLADRILASYMLAPGGHA